MRVVDESGQPIPGAEACVGYYVAPGPGESIAGARRCGLTDTNGAFVASGWEDSVLLNLVARKDGFYTTRLEYELGLPYEYNPVRWNPKLTLVLKKVMHPVPMYVSKVRRDIPDRGKPIGLDLMEGDWVEPYGKGKVSDLVFNLTVTGNFPRDFESKLIISFSNRGDGIQEFDLSLPRDQGSELKSTHEAPADGYQAQLVRGYGRHPGQTGVLAYDNRRNYFVRIRTVLDQSGGVKSALYGKLYGDFDSFWAYVNPVPNSRNLEFDGKHTLGRGGNLGSPMY